MSKYITTVIKTGNSYALRVPKAYVDNAKLELGDKASISLPAQRKRQNHKQIQSLWEELQSLKPFKDIADPVAWQKADRRDRRLPGRK